MDSRIKSQSTQMATKGQENLKWEGVIGTPIEVNFDPLKLAWLVTCGVQSASSFRHHACCSVGKTNALFKVCPKICLPLSTATVLIKVIIIMLLFIRCLRKAGSYLIKEQNKK